MAKNGKNMGQKHDYGRIWTLRRDGSPLAAGELAKFARLYKALAIFVFSLFCSLGIVGLIGDRDA